MRIYFLLIFGLILTGYSNQGSCQAGRHEVTSLGSKVNSPSDEQNPVLSPDGTRLFFTISKHPENTGSTKDLGDIWYSELDSAGNWSTAVNAGEPLNNKQLNAVIGFFNNGRGLYLVGHYERSGRKSDTEGISVSYLRGDDWSFPQPVDVRYFKKYSDMHHVSLSFDRRIMLHSLESYNSRGAEDIYVSFRNVDGTWSDIQNLGSTINTEFQEMTPFLAADNKTLFFASNGHGGVGSSDIFVTKRLDDTWKNWSEPQNLGEPMNTPGRELYYYVISGSDEAFFCSTQNSDGYGDIKRYRLLPEDVIEVDQIEEPLTIQEPMQVLPVKETVQEPAQEPVQETAQEPVSETRSYMLSGKILDAKSDLPVAGRISIYYPNENELASQESEESSGKFNFEIASQDNYLIRINARGYLSLEENLNMDDFEEMDITRNFRLEPIEIGKTYKLDHVLFFRGTADMIDTSYVQLNLVVSMIQENTDINIELHGHTDNQGNAKKNVILSQDRVDVVKQYLVDHGVDENRITGKGWGGSKPIASNAGERTRRLNRRVEFVIKER
ncbi:OmpA family protein [Bacteroidota bacterium]